MIEKHDLHHEFPEYHDRIHELKQQDILRVCLRNTMISIGDS